MNLRPIALPRPVVVPPLGWWLLALGLFALVLFGLWPAAIAVMTLVIIQRARPFHFLTSYLMVVFVGSFINYSSGDVTHEMWILTAFLIFTLYCYLLSRRWDALVVPKTPATTPLLLYLGLTIVNFIRGLAIGNNFRWGGLELLACLAIASCMLVASRRLSDRELWATTIGMWAMGTAHFLLGAYIFSIIHTRTVGVYFTPVPGLVAVLMFNFALRQQTRARMFLWVVAMAPMLAQQFLSFTRGFWNALIISVLFSVIVYVGRGTGFRLRAGRAATTLVMVVGMAIVGVIAIALVLGINQIWELAGTRFASSTGTKVTFEASSNIARLAETFHVLGLIAQNPIFGHGIGYSFVFREPNKFTLHEQWYVHEYYLQVMLKQGLIGLIFWVWMLIGFVRTGIRGRNLPTVMEQSWCTGAAAAVVYCMAYSLVHFPFAETNTTFTFALLTGVAMRLSTSDTIALRWKGRRTLPEET